MPHDVLDVFLAQGFPRISIFGRKKGVGERKRRTSPPPPVDIETAELPPLRVIKVDELKGDNVHSRALVVYREETNEYIYFVIEPELTSRDREIISEIRDLLTYTLEVPREKFPTREEAEAYIEGQVLDSTERFGLRVPRHRLDKILYYIKRDTVGFGKIDVVMRDPYIEDVSCDGIKVPVYVWHKDFESISSNIVFETINELNTVILRFAYVSSRTVSIANPILDATLPDGSRINAVLGGQVATRGGSFTIRKFTEKPYTIVELITKGTMDEFTAAYFWELMEYKKSLMIAGAAASGKTTTLNAIANFIHPDYKIVSIEDTRELRLYQQNWAPMITRSAWGEAGGGEIDAFELLRAALRQRPDYIIVGEVRGKEAYTLLQAMTTGHSGLTTIHADSVMAVTSRLSSPPIDAPKALIANSVDAITMQLRLVSGGQPIRRIMEIAEIEGYDAKTDEIELKRVMKWDPTADKIKWLGESKLLNEIAEFKGIPTEDVMDELDGKRMILGWMVKQNMIDFHEVANVIRNYYRNKLAVISRVRMELGTSKG